MLRRARLFAAAAIMLPSAAPAEQPQTDPLANATVEAERLLHQSFANIQFEDFGPAPVKGQIFQAIAGGRVIYFAPESEHIIFGALYDKNGVNLTALAQDASARKRFASLDEADALVIGPANAPVVIEFTDPDCPYCQALERFWATKAAEGMPVRRLVYFVTTIHPEAAGLAQHILCSPDQPAAFRAVYSGKRPTSLLKCKAGADKLARDAQTVRRTGITGTPTLLVDGKLLSGFQQAELEAFLTAKRGSPAKGP